MVMNIFSRHRRLKELLSAYLDQQVSAKESMRVEAHLDVCDECREYQRSMRMTVSLLQKMPALAAPRSFKINAAQVGLVQAPASKTPSYLTWSLRAAVPVAAVLLIAVVVTDVSGVGRDTSSNETAALAMTEKQLDAASGTGLAEGEEFDLTSEVARAMTAPDESVEGGSEESMSSMVAPEATPEGMESLDGVGGVEEVQAVTSAPGGESSIPYLPIEVGLAAALAALIAALVVVSSRGRWPLGR